MLYYLLSQVGDGREAGELTRDADSVAADILRTAAEAMPNVYRTTHRTTPTAGHASPRARTTTPA